MNEMTIKIDIGKLLIRALGWAAFLAIIIMGDVLVRKFATTDCTDASAIERMLDDERAQ